MILLGLGSTLVKSKGSLRLTVQSNESFHPRKILIPSRLSHSLLLVSFKVQRSNQFGEGIMSSAAVPADVLESIEWDIGLCRRGQFISVVFQNTSEEDLMFEGAVTGPKPSFMSRFKALVGL